MFTRYLATSWLIAFTACLVSPVWAFAQIQEQGKPHVEGDEDFWSGTRKKAAAAVELIAARQPITVAVMRLTAREVATWGDLEFAENLAPTLNRDLLEDMVDGRPMPDIRAKEEKQISRADRAMFRTYNQAVIYAFEQPVDAFKTSAKRFEHVKFSHLWSQTKEHRGEIVPLKGRLVRLRQQPATVEIQQKTGLEFVYEGWVFGETKKAFPYAVIFPVLPRELKVSEDLNTPVSFVGYFLGKIRIVTAGKEEISVPLLVGPTIFPEGAVAAQPVESMPFYGMAILVGSVIVVVAAVVFVIAVVFRRGDRKIQEQLEARRHGAAAESLPGAAEGAEGLWTDAELPNGISAGPSDPIRRL